MKKNKFVRPLAAVAALSLLLLFCGCGRSDLILTVNGDGSFHADITYGIEKALMANAEVEEQVKSLITDALNQNGIPYTEGENKEYVTISVERDFANINELTSEEAWRGVGMTPGFSFKQEPGKLWIRVEDGLLKIDGTLDAAAFGADELVSQGGEPSSSFGGSFSVRMYESGDDVPLTAESCNIASSSQPPQDGTYTWSGTSEQSVEVSISYALPESMPISEAAQASDETVSGTENENKNEAAAGSDGAAESSDGNTSQGGVNYAMIILLLVILIIAVAAALRLRKAKNAAVVDEKSAESSALTKPLENENNNNETGNEK